MRYDVLDITAYFIVCTKTGAENYSALAGAAVNNNSLDHGQINPSIMFRLLKKNPL